MTANRKYELTTHHIQTMNKYSESTGLFLDRKRKLGEQEEAFKKESGI
jgi:hypothetical protein